jgi:hypothetical protein
MEQPTMSPETSSAYLIYMPCKNLKTKKYNLLFCRIFTSVDFSRDT